MNYIAIRKNIFLKRILVCTLIIILMLIIDKPSLHPALAKEEVEFPKIHTEMKLVDLAFKEQGLDPPSHHAYPFGGHNFIVQDIVAQYRQTARGITSGINIPPYNFRNLLTVAVFETSSMVRLKGWVDQIQYTTDGVLIFYTHAVLTEDLGRYDVTPEKLEEILDYAVESGVTITTIDEAFDMEGEPRIVFTIDDGFDTDYYVVFPMFQERGLLATSYINTGTLGKDGKLTWEQIKKMLEAGWDIQCHSHTHPNLRHLTLE